MKVAARANSIRRTNFYTQNVHLEKLLYSLQLFSREQNKNLDMF